MALPSNRFSTKWRLVNLSDAAEYPDTRVSMAEVNAANYVGVDNMLIGNVQPPAYAPSSGRVVSYKIGDLLLSNIRPYLKKHWLANRNGGCSADVLVIRAKSGQILPDYLCVNLSSDGFFKYVMLGAKGMKMPRGDKNHVMQYRMLLPPLPEQRRIVAVLETWDRAIENLKRCIEIKKGIRKELTRKLLANETSYSKENWTTTCVGGLGRLVSGGTPSRQIEMYWNGEIPWISSSDLRENDINFVNIHRYITTDAIDNSTTNLIPEGSVIIVSRVGVGKVIVSREELCTSQDFQSLILNKSKADPRFIGHILTLELQKLLIRNQGTSIKGFLKKDLEDLTIVIPSIIEQQRIAAILDDSDRCIESLERKLAILTAQKTFLLNNLITGTIRTPETLNFSA